MASATMMKIMTDRAKALGIKIVLQTPVQKLVKKKGQVVGAIAEDQSGGTVEARGKAVIIATGGFGNNLQMVKKHTGFELGKDMHGFRIPGLDGDGVRMAWEAGAARTEMTMEMIYTMPDHMSLPPQLYGAFREPHLMVNLQGNRFLNEAIMPNMTFTGNAIAIQKDRCAFTIFDEVIKKQMEIDFDFRNIVFPVTRFENADDVIQDVLKQGYPHIFVAETLEELAEKTGISSKGLLKTVEEYNRSCTKGYDDLFNKPHKYLRPIETPKFYAGRHFPGAYGTLGGIKINDKAEVLDKKWEVIPGLYAAGTDACTIYGDSYVFVLPGNTMGFALNTGRIAGENAAKYIKS
jgi:fumarate reductase flavoprotein subunit